jgi:hypothetical protein
MRAKLLASICNDLLVISHSLSARLFMPRHESISYSVLAEYTLSLLTTELSMNPSERPSRSYCDVGRLADLVSEMGFLRQEVDELTTETQCPKNGLLPHLRFAARKSRPVTPSTPRGRSRAPSVVEFTLGDGNWGVGPGTSGNLSVAQPESVDGEVEVRGDERV